MQRDECQNDVNARAQGSTSPMPKISPLALHLQKPSQRSGASEDDDASLGDNYSDDDHQNEQVLMTDVPAQPTGANRDEQPYEDDYGDDASYGSNFDEDT